MKKTIYGVILTTVTLMATIGQMQAQMIQSLWHADHVGYRLPGTISEEGLVISLPSIGLGLYNSGFTYNDLVGATTNGVTTLNVDEVLDQLDPVNTLAVQGSVQTLGVGWKMKNLWLEVGHQVRYENYFDYPKDLFGVFFRGNAPYIGQTVDLGLQVNSMLYSEIYAGIAGKIGTVSVGGRLKWLNGAIAARTERSKLELYTSDDVYQLTVNSDYLLHTTPELDILQGDDTDPTLGTKDYRFSDLITRNTGIAFDLGVQVDLTERLSLRAAVMDIGQINWKDEVVSYTSNKTIQYDGFDFSNLFFDDSLSLAGALDTLETLLEFDEESGGSFTTRLPWTFQVGGHYQFTEKFGVSAVFFGQSQSTDLYSGISIGANVRHLSFLEGGLTYTVFAQTYTNIGAHLLLRLGPVRLYAASDNLISLLGVNDSQFANGRVGMQLAF